MSAHQTEGKSPRKLRETGTASQPPRQESGENDRGPSADRREDLSATGSAQSHGQMPAADPAGFETMYLRFLNLKRAFKNLNHSGQEPSPKAFGLSDREAAFCRVRVEREFFRKG